MSQDRVSDAERARYTEALIFCRGSDYEILLRSNQRILCLDGPVVASRDLLPAQDLLQGGLFVVRSDGVAGEANIAATLQLAEISLEKGATVVVRDYCLGVCADYLVFASEKTYVPPNTLVAWRNHATGPNSCVFFMELKDSDVPYLGEGLCSREVDPRTEELIQLKTKFYKARNPPMKLEPPESIAVRRMLKREFDGTGRYPLSLDWTWNPRYYAGSVRTKVFYEAYPKSQEEVDALAAQFHLPRPIIYDP